MSEPSCRICKGILPSGAEQHLEHCLHCLSGQIGLSQLRKINLESLRNENAELQEKVKQLQKDVELRDGLLAAEQQGLATARTNPLANENDNPFPKEDGRALFWESGLFSGLIERRLDEHNAVVLWSIDSLKHVAELALGYGQQEIAEKISIVSDRLDKVLE